MKGPKDLSEMKGKTRKASGGHRNPVETMAESEEFGSSGRIDTEIAASEDSCATKKRCISLGGNDNDRFRVPVQFYSLSKMSQSERKNLEMSLKGELEQIKYLRKKIASRGSNCATISPASDENRRKITVKSEKAVGISALPGKKRAPQTKISAVSRSDSVNRQVVPMNAPMSLLMKQCETLLSRLMQQYSDTFNWPVDVVKFNIPDYYNVIKHPMDLGTVKSKLSSGEYSSPLSFAEDVRLTYSNAMTYNPKGNYYHNIAKDMNKYFEVRWKHIEKKLHAIKSELAHSKSSVSIETETAIPMPQLIRSRSSVSVEAETAKCLPLPLKSKSSRHLETKTAKPQVKPLVENTIKQEPCKPTVTLIDRKKISTELGALLDELPKNIFDFLKKISSNGNQAGVPENEFEIDFDTFTNDTCFQLKKLLDDYSANKQKKEAKAEEGVLQLHDESGLSNSFLQPVKGNDPVEEDIDIGDNDMPISSFPLLEIEKEDTVKNTRCGSSSSSSGDSDSSSSDSDSDSGESSGSEVDGGKCSIATNTAKETVVSEATIEQKKTNNTNTGKHGLNQRDQDCVQETDILRSGGERPASPDKLYRAAVLRNRFADTILKAQEKTILRKVENQDPEKVRREREELERRRKEEKGRLQAEAKAAEEARKKAEAEAVGEAKRKRELEREAARQALQKMEKTVDINENCQFMGDFEMLGVVPDENIVMDNDKVDQETSPDNFCGGAGSGSFKFQGSSNPLQQLGLYMKDDYDDEEEFNDAKNDSPPEDPEEGEID